MIYTSLMYHEIVSPKLHKYSVEPSRFEEQMRRLQKEVVSYIFENQENAPRTEGVRYCLLTFDDGHKSNLNAARLLSELIDCIRSGIPELKYIRTSRYGVNHVGDTVIKSIGVRGDYSTEKVLNIATNDFWTMRKIVAYYHAKQIVKPLYHFVKR